jgi:PelA/Pel-15E family pectate lyase
MQYDPFSGYPRATDANGRWQLVPINEWTSGFFPGTLWYLSTRVADGPLTPLAYRWTLPLLRIPRGTFTHDLGFQYNSSFGNGYRFTGQDALAHEALNGARLLAARFDPDVGAIKSWNWTEAARPFPVIVDNMMNLELLFWGARQPDGDPRWRNIAIQHARTTASNHIRADGGSFHVVVFDPNNGRMLERITHQGHADSTTWARGQAWLIYGFTMTYRETGDPFFLNIAEQVATYFVDRLPAGDPVPCWDFQAPGCPQSARRDASAAAIAASGLLELSTYHATNGDRYRNAALRMLSALASPRYRAAPDEGEAILKHAVGHHPRGTEVDVGLAYGDYYFIEGVLRAKQLSGDTVGRVMPAYTPRVFTHRGELMREARERPSAQAFRALLREADSMMTVGPFTVTAKQATPPSGSKNDYVSYAPYWWPDSTKANGLPYVRRDGQVNQALRRDSDVLRWYAMVDAVETLSHAYYFSGRAHYADRAALLLRAWFIDPQTRMNPHLNFGQAIPGVTEGRGIGIIDTRDLGRLTDAVTLLRHSRAWTERDQQAMTTWFGSYRDWLLNSPHGRDEADEANNHGTWYDVQVVALSLFLNDTATARRVLNNNTKARIAAQIDTAGRQPLELARTRSLHYSVENLEGFTRLAEMARHVDVDLWSSLRKAIDFITPYSDPAASWPHQQITAEAPDLFVPLLRRARVAYNDNKYRTALNKLDQTMVRAHRMNLLYPELRRVSQDSLLSATRLRGLPPAERAAWERYIAQSAANDDLDRGALGRELRALGRSDFTPAPSGPGFFVVDSMTAQWFATPAATRLGNILATYQTPSGGWSKRVDFTRPRAQGESFSADDDWTWVGTLDNGATTEQLKFLGRLLAAQPDTALQRSFTAGVRYLLAAQMPNGCWPQVYPLMGSYHDAITFNDDASVNAVRVFEGVVRGDHKFVPPSVTDSARAAIANAISCILRTQVNVNGFKTVWGAQHDPLTWQPVKARAYEHASLSGRESAAILDFLMRIPNPGDSVQTAIHAAAAWFKANAINGYSYTFRGGLTADPNTGPIWARFYEIGTNRPIFSDRDGIVRYHLSEIGEERRRGYGWYTDEPITTLRRYERWARNYPVKS